MISDRLLNLMTPVLKWDVENNCEVKVISIKCCKCRRLLTFLSTDEDNYYVTCCGVLHNKNGVTMNEDIFD